MARRKKREESGGASWLETYSDMVTLLLTFL
ncbi:MAG TPA: flagellar motor protein MotB [Sedimentibacter sp.]|nr:flagellar motor protein MotB [Sedimentibacter sp.]